MESNPKINRVNYLIGPSIAHADWTPDQVWETNFVPAYSQYLSAVTVEKWVSLVSYLSIRLTRCRF